MSIESWLFRRAADVALPGSGEVLGIWAKVRAFLRSIPWQVWLGLAIAVAIWVGVRVVEHKITAAHDAGYAEGVRDTKAAFTAAQAKADAAQRAKNDIHAAKSAAIDTGATNALLNANDDIDRRAAALRVRHDAADAAGSGGIRPLPQTIVAPGGIAPPATCDGLSWDAQLAVLTAAAKLQAQLIAILDWEDEQDKLAARDGSDGAADSSEPPQ
jgi:hypothetical protein